MTLPPAPWDLTDVETIKSVIVIQHCGKKCSAAAFCEFSQLNLTR